MTNFHAFFFLQYFGNCLGVSLKLVITRANEVAGRLLNSGSFSQYWKEDDKIISRLLLRAEFDGFEKEHILITSTIRLKTTFRFVED